MTDHLNAARPLIDGPDGTRELRDLNLAAGRRARDAAAHEAADAYLRAAVDLVAERDWQSALAEVLRIHAEAAESACAVGDYPRCDALLERALDAAAAPEHTTLLNRVKLDSLSAQGRHTEALDLGRALLAERGRRYPARPGRRHALAAFARLRWRMRDVSLDTLRALPDLVDPEMVHEMAIGERLGAAAAFAQPELLPLLACRGAEAALTHGVSERTMVTFGGIGVLLCTTFGRVEAAEKYNRFALELTDRFPDDPARGRVQLHHAAFVQPWMTPLEETLEPLTRAYEACFACGDWDGAAQAVTYRASYLWLSGRSLATVIKDVDQWRSAIADLNQVEAVQYIDALHQHLLNLTGQADDPARLKGSSYDIDVMLPEHERTASRRMLNAAHGRQAMLKYQFGDPAGALPHADLVREHLPGFEHIFDGLMIHYFDALTRLAVAATASGRARRRLLRQVQASRRQIGRWAERAQFNALAKKLTVDAEWHRIHGREDRAQTLYDAAVDAARRHDMPSDEAIANRLAGEMHHAAGRATIAEAYLTKACHAYRRWGGDALADYLEQRHPAIARRRAAVPAAERSQRGTDASTHLNQIDLSALMKALRAIAGERVHSRMVQTIIDTAMAFAGAQHGVLLLRDADGGLRIEAEATVDGGPSQILQSLPIEDGSPLCRPVVNYVDRARRGIVIHDAAEPAEAIPGVTRDAHVVASGVRSILCLPIIAATEQINTLIGMLYLENRRTSHTFTEARFETLEIICMAAAGRLELSRKAAVDGLTGLFNRDYFQTMLRQEFLNSQRHGRDLAVILADIDHFKGFNDTWGHQLGDEVLQAVAAAVRGACRESDVAARYGGEELAVILPNTDAQGAVEAAERIRGAVEAVRIEHGGEALSVTLSAGVAALRHGTGSEDELLRQADAALYDAKRAGRNRVQIA
ncbi:MAG: hypothetical protein CMQ43_08890 [Gammaproteobacteria bacterium]|nr:hypothetical protein [Gammaproteobacteria bacterium]MBK81014.1 hypothetical protein [Gammaproteobacteria bacterium]